MLLRSIVHHVQQQNWLAVFLDFVIVVAGVFIATQVNDWSEQLDQQQMERDALISLAADISETAQNLEQQIQFAEQGYASLKVLAEVGDGQHDDMRHDEVDLHVYQGLYRTQSVNPNMLTINELQNTGRLSLIQDATLRRQLQLLYSKVEDLAESSEMTLSMTFNVSDPLMLELYDWRGFMPYGNVANLTAATWLDPTKNRRSPIQALKDHRFLNLVLYRARLNRTFFNNAVELRTLLKSINERIERRLNIL